MPINIKIEISDTPSVAIRQALDDLREIEKDPRYVVDMWMWHTPCRDAGVCEVCLAGAVMARAINDPKKLTSPSCLTDRDVIMKLLGLDKFRNGAVRHGVHCFDKSRTTPTHLYFVEVPDYEYDRDGFYAAMEAMANSLEKEGL